MVRVVTVILIVWSMAVQPLMADVPTQTPASSAYDSMVSLTLVPNRDDRGGTIQHITEAPKAPCHEHTEDAAEPESEQCNHCTFKCTNNEACASSCISGGIVVGIETMGLPMPENITLAFSSAGVLTTPPLCRIFHPPRMC